MSLIAPKITNQKSSSRRDEMKNSLVQGRLMHLASIRNGEVVGVVLCIRAQSTAGKGFPKEALVCTIVSVRVGLNPSVTRGHESGLAWLDREGIDEEVQPNDVAFGATETKVIE